MPLLAAFFTSLAGSLVAFVADWFSKRATVAFLAASSIAVAMALLVASFNLLVSPLVLMMFSTEYGQFIGLAFPPIAGTCIAAIGSSWAACALYKLKVATIKATASA